MEQEKENKGFLYYVEEHPKLVFWARFISWLMFVCVLPFSFIVWRFQLFHTISKVQIGGWGIIAIIIVAVTVFAILRYVRIALKAKYTFVGQCITGFCKVIIPLLSFLIILNNIKSNIDLFIQVMGVVTLCEFIAIPLNPLPKWAYEAQKNVRAEERKEATDYFLDSFFSRKEKNENK